jgi:hypothetical protein
MNTMRVHAMMLVFAALANGQVPQNDKSVIAGKVVNLRGEPLRQVDLKLRAIRPGSQALTTSTDNEGNFAFEGLDPAIYLLSATHAGYLGQSYGTRTPGLLGHGLEIHAGTGISVIIAMTPQGLVAGRVTDEDGDPVTGIQVNLYEVHWFNYTRRIEIAGTASLNPDGTFIVGNLMPGRYYARASGAKGIGWVPTWFPDTTDFSTAARIDVSPGAEIGGINLRLRRGVFQIRGTVTGAPKNNVLLRLIPTGTGPRTEIQQTTELPASGAFAIPGVAPGSYAIVATPAANQHGDDPFNLIAYAAVTVNDRDATGVAMALGPGIEIHGKVRMEDGSPPSEPVSIQLLEYDPLTGQESFEGDDKGEFFAGHLLPERYRIDAYGPPGSYLKSVQFAGRNINPDDLDLTAGIGGTLELVFSPHAASVGGTVRDKDGNPVPFAMVALWPVSTSELPKASNADGNGRFRWSNLIPGDYRVLAWDTVNPSLLQNPDFLAAFEGSAKRVSLQEAAIASVEVTMNDQDAAAAEIGKLP